MKSIMNLKTIGALLGGLGLGGDRFDHRCRHFRFDGDLDFELGQEAHGVFGAAIDFRMPLLTPIPFDLRHGHSLDTQCGEGFPHLVQLERLNNRGDKLHRWCFRLLWPLNTSSRTMPESSFSLSC